MKASDVKFYEQLEDLADTEYTKGYVQGYDDAMFDIGTLTWADKLGQFCIGIALGASGTLFIQSIL